MGEGRNRNKRNALRLKLRRYFPELHRVVEALLLPLNFAGVVEVED
jgi:hypothetical protein